MSQAYLIPVLDIRGGQAVHAAGGQRERYQPLRSVLTPFTDPHGVAQALIDRCQAQTLYVADLDAIERRDGVSEHSRTLGTLPAAVWLDAGCHSLGQVHAALDCGVDSVVLSLEALPNRASLIAIAGSTPADRLVFSLDMRDGQPIACAEEWRGNDPAWIAAQAYAAGIRRLIILDLAAIGTGSGITTLDLCTRLKEMHCEWQITLGGGIRSLQDADTAMERGASSVLVASAFHDGRITPESLAHWHATRRNPTGPVPLQSPPEGSAA